MPDIREPGPEPGKKPGQKTGKPNEPHNEPIQPNEVPSAAAEPKE